MKFYQKTLKKLVLRAVLGHSKNRRFQNLWLSREKLLIKIPLKQKSIQRGASTKKRESFFIQKYSRFAKVFFRARNLSQK